MKKLIQKISLIVAAAFVGMAAQSTHAFSAMYVFGDALSTTNGNTQASAYPKDYYGNRYSNGRVWVEVLAQRQGIPIAYNWSYFDCNSANLKTNVQNFNITPAAASNALFVVWCVNSDLYDIIARWGNTNATTWATNILIAQTNEFRAITNLYAKGARTIIMPGAVDLSEVPAYSMNYQPVFLKYVRQQCNAYNTSLANTLNQIRAACPGLTIYQPNFFSLLDNVLTNAAFYGLTNALGGPNGLPIDAMDALYPNCSTNGLGANYVYWDNLDPSARFHAVIADFVQQSISPVQIAAINVVNNSNQVVVANAPIGLNGFLEGCTNLASPNWTVLQNISSTAAAQSYLVPVPVPATQGSANFAPRDITPPGPGGTVIVTALEFYRVHYPYQWVWP